VSAPAAAPKAPRARDEQRIVDARFVAGGPRAADLPPPVGAEIAFAGRSNVGKSSLINALTERRGLVRTSSTPGSTRQINLFEARARDGARFHLVDLPGYGFAKRSKSERATWAATIEDYVASRPTLAAVVLIVDARRGLEGDDRDLVEFVEAARHPSRRPVQVLVVATKVDKVASSTRQTALTRIRDAAGRKVIGFSSETGEGKEALWFALRRATFGETSAASSAPAPAAPAAPLQGDPPERG
jgi:GTP-binding protein